MGKEKLLGVKRLAQPPVVEADAAAKKVKQAVEVGVKAEEEEADEKFVKVVLVVLSEEVMAFIKPVHTGVRYSKVRGPLFLYFCCRFVCII